MDRIAFFFCEHYIYWSSVLLFVAVCVAILMFLALYIGRSGKIGVAFSAVPLAAVLSCFCARVIHWYCFSEIYSGFAAAMTDYSQGGFALVGVFAGCALTVGLLAVRGYVQEPGQMLDCMCLAGGVGIAVGRLSSFFTTADRGQLLENIQTLPMAAPVINVVSKATEYRLATFVLQAIATGAITLVLLVFYLSRRGRKWKNGEVSLLFLLCYCTAQVILDSTRYDAMYFRSNGFVSVVQVLGAVAVVAITVLFSVRLVKKRGWHFGYIPVWVLMAGLLGCAGYMEYYVQRHGNQAAMSYSIMSAALWSFVILALVLRALAGKKVAEPVGSEILEEAAVCPAEPVETDALEEAEVGAVDPVESAAQEETADCAAELVGSGT